MTNIEQVIEALEMAVDTCRLRPSVDDCLETHDACQKALTTIRSLTEHGEGPYNVEQGGAGINMKFRVRGNGYFSEWFVFRKDAMDCMDAMNAAFQAGRLSAELQRPWADKATKAEAIGIASRRIAEEHRKHNRLPDWPAIAATKMLAELSELGYLSIGAAEFQLGEPVAPTVEQIMGVFVDWCQHGMEADPIADGIKYEWKFADLRSSLTKLMAPKS